jgi:hypothetical protein
MATNYVYNDEGEVAVMCSSNNSYAKHMYDEVLIKLLLLPMNKNGGFTPEVKAAFVERGLEIKLLDPEWEKEVRQSAKDNADSKVEWLKEQAERDGINIDTIIIDAKRYEIDHFFESMFRWCTVVWVAPDEEFRIESDIHFGPYIVLKKNDLKHTYYRAPPSGSVSTPSTI